MQRRPWNIFLEKGAIFNTLHFLLSESDLYTNQLLRLYFS
jgi:hypothetical protein